MIQRKIQKAMMLFAAATLWLFSSCVMPQSNSQGCCEEGEMVLLASLSTEVQRTITQYAAGAEIDEIEHEFEGDLELYSVEIEGPDGDREFEVAADGRFLGWETDDDDDDDDDEHGDD